MRKRTWNPLRLAGIVTCAFALLASMAGCSGRDAGSGTSTADSNTASGGSSEEREIKDLNGYKWSYLSVWGTDNARFNPVEGDSAADDAYLERNRQLMDDYHFEMEIKSQAVETFFATIMSTAMAGEKIADVVNLEYQGMQTLRVAEVLNPFDSTCMPAIDLNDGKWQKAITEASTFGGKVYGISDERPSGSMCFFNATLLEEKNVTSPYELYKAGNWTWEEFKKLAKAMTIDENGDGTPDIYGIGTVDWGNLHFETPFIYANGGDAVKYNTDGTPRFAYTDNDAQEALEFVKTLYAEKLVLPELPTEESGAVTAFSTRKTAFMFETYGFVGWIKDMEDDYGMVPFPKGPSASDHVVMSSLLGLYVTTIGTPVEDYEASSLIFDLLTDPLPETGDETVDDPLYSLRNDLFRDDDAVQIYLDMTEKVVPCQPNVIPGLTVLTSQAIISCVKDNATSPKSAMESITDQAQTLIDDFFTKKE